MLSLDRRLVQDEASAALVGEVRPGPLEQHDEAIAEADEKEDVHEQPAEPGEESRQAQAAPPCTTNGSTWAEGYAGVWHLSETNSPEPPLQFFLSILQIKRADLL